MKVLLGLLGYSCKIHRKLSKSSGERLSLSEGGEHKFDRSFSSEEGQTEFDPKNLPSKGHSSNSEEKLSSSRTNGEEKPGSEREVSSTDQSGVENNKSGDLSIGSSFFVPYFALLFSSCHWLNYGVTHCARFRLVVLPGMHAFV